MDYHLKPLGKVCAATGKPLVPGTLCHSVLIEKDGVQLRLDFSPEGWPGIQPEHLGYWTVEVPAAPSGAAVRIDPEAAFRYFEQLSEEANSEQEKMRYVLALLLLQKRKLKLENVRFNDDDEQLELIGTNGEGEFHVRNYRLKDDEINRMRGELNAQLAVEWPS